MNPVACGNATARARQMITNQAPANDKPISKEEHNAYTEAAFNNQILRDSTPIHINCFLLSKA